VFVCLFVFPEQAEAAFSISSIFFFFSCDCHVPASGAPPSSSFFAPQTSSKSTLARSSSVTTRPCSRRPSRRTACTNLSVSMSRGRSTIGCHMPDTLSTAARSRPRVGTAIAFRCETRVCRPSSCSLGAKMVSELSASIPLWLHHI
jgi:hypothetical protein